MAKRRGLPQGHYSSKKSSFSLKVVLPTLSLFILFAVSTPAAQVGFANEGGECVANCGDNHVTECEDDHEVDDHGEGSSGEACDTKEDDHSESASQKEKTPPKGKLKNYLLKN